MGKAHMRIWPGSPQNALRFLAALDGARVGQPRLCPPELPPDVATFDCTDFGNHCARGYNPNDYFYRVDPARPEMRQQRHVHIAHKKHLNSATQQVSWNSDQTRHD